MFGKLGFVMRRAAFSLGVLMALFQLYTAGVRLLPAQQQRVIHLGLALAIIFLSVPMSKKKGDSEGPIAKGISLIFSFASFAVATYLLLNFEALIYRVGSPNLPDMIVGIALILLVLEASRRMLGWPMVIISLVFLGYAFYGQYMPMLVKHTGYSLERIVSAMSLGSEGILGSTIGVSATYIIAFVIFGAFLEQSGAGKFFIDIAISIFGTRRGGPAKAAVSASALFGTVSGSQVANVCSSGVLTIPLMKKSGYKAEFAGAVEAAASTGGMFLPPVMGATAFVMAEVLQLKYIDIAIAAALPAALYYIALYIMVDLKAAHMGLQGIKRVELPKVRPLIKEQGHLMIPLLVLVFFLFVTKDSASKAAFWGTVATPLACLLRRKTWMSLKSIIVALEKGIQTSLIIVAAVATAGIIIGVINLSGIGLRLSATLISIAGNNLVILSILSMIVSLILGMGLPPLAAYIVLAVLAAPAMVTMGVDPLAAHLFIFFFGIIGAVTPPVAVAAYAAAGLAGSDPNRTGLIAFRLAAVAFIIPFQFIYGPSLILKGNLSTIIFTAVTALIGVYVLAVALEGYFRKPVGLVWRICLGVAAILLMNADITLSLLGLGIGALVILKESRGISTGLRHQSVEPVEMKTSGNSGDI